MTLPLTICNQLAENRVPGGMWKIVTTYLHMPGSGPRAISLPLIQHGDVALGVLSSLFIRSKAGAQSFKKEIGKTDFTIVERE